MRDTSNLDPFLGLEEIRRDVLGLSKSSFYGPSGFVHSLPITQLGPRRRGVRRSDLDRVLAARTSEPRALAES